MFPKMKIARNHVSALLVATTIACTGSIAATQCDAAVYLDGSSIGCSNGSSNYSPTTRSCGSGSDTIYTTLASFESGLTAGATNYIRKGNYFADGPDVNTGALNIPSGKSGTQGSPTIIKAYPGEERTVVIGTAKRGATYNSNPSDSTGAGSWLYYPCPAVSTTSASYVTIDGIKTYGEVYLVGGHDLTLQNSDVGGGGPLGNQGNTVRLNVVYNVLIKNNLIHDNCRRTESDDGSALIGYSYTATIDGNTFYNGYGNDLENKDATGQTGRTTEIKNNFFASSSKGPYSTGIRGYNQAPYAANVYVHNNIFNRKTTGYITLASPTNSHIIYNNTFVNCGADITNPASGGPYPILTYNNIFYHSTSGGSFFTLYALNYLSASDFNIYYSTGNWNKSAPGGLTWASTLPNWKSFSALDVSSLSTDPTFVNVAGTTPADFKRSSYPENFTSSKYSTHAGAYPTGTEAIGFTTTSQSATSTTPAAPTLTLISVTN